MRSRGRLKARFEGSAVTLRFSSWDLGALALGVMGLCAGVAGGAAWAMRQPDAPGGGLLRLAMAGAALVGVAAGAVLGAFAWRRHRTHLAAGPDGLVLTRGGRAWRMGASQVREVRIHMVPVGPPDAPDAEVEAHLDCMTRDGSLWYLAAGMPRLRTERAGRALAQALGVPMRVMRVRPGARRPPNRCPPAAPRARAGDQHTQDPA